ncbi:MAG: hypothetical protein Q8O91_05965 [Candidatus Aminicenantes bacterium]|nr:hypothetical protein [Candidatus Aminicenantes bacterium]
MVVDAPAFADKKINILSVSQQRFVLLSRILHIFLFGSILLCWGFGRRNKSSLWLLIDKACGYCGMVLIFGFNLKAQFVVLFLPRVFLLTLTIQSRSLKCLPLNMPNTLLLAAVLLTWMANPGLIGRAASNWVLAYSAITVGTMVLTGLLIRIQLGGRLE